jgi:hypothetical protein
MLHCVAVVRTNVLEECITSIIRVIGTSELGTTLAVCMPYLLVTANVPSLLVLVTVMMDVIHSTKISVLTRSTWHNIPEDGTFLALFK